MMIEKIKKILAEIPDPEIPVITIEELGIVRNIELVDGTVNIQITPTYSGCPAMKEIEVDIKKKLQDSGFSKVNIEMIYHPAWTTDWITDAAKEKLRKYGIAPPAHSTVDKGALLGKPKIIACPQCASKNVEMISQFGSTACKALYKCLDCREPFDYFKCI
ncbi:MAG: phenylacetate-CoA oxygenase subunit PaaJ [Bacteroidetes bacterium]|nr:phenylacetate-CoA oxygenase subunit PaaJ [Bacteroidota bacterium]